MRDEEYEVHFPNVLECLDQCRISVELPGIYDRYDKIEYFIMRWRVKFLSTVFVILMVTQRPLTHPVRSCFVAKKNRFGIAFGKVYIRPS